MQNPPQRNQPRRAPRRRGAAAVEAAFVLSVLLVLLFGLLDLGLAVLRYNSLSECARRAARQAIVLGERSAAPLGPAEWSGGVDSPHPLTDAVRPLLLTMRPQSVRLRAAWPDGDDRVGDRVYVELRFDHRPLLPRLFGVGPWELAATSTMWIAH